MLTYEILMVIATLCGSQQYSGTSNRLQCAKEMIVCYKQPRITRGITGVAECVEEVAR